MEEKRFSEHCKGTSRRLRQRRIKKKRDEIIIPSHRRSFVAGENGGKKFHASCKIKCLLVSLHLNFLDIPPKKKKEKASSTD